MDRQEQPRDLPPGHHSAEEDERDRRATNIFLAVAAVLVVGGGLWLVDAMLASRQAQLCMESGRRNCNPIAVPPRQPD
jgi:hypothetical protein